MDRVCAWRDAWQKKDIDLYMSFYSPTFKSGKLDYKGWRKMKILLFQRPGSISVDISGLDISTEQQHAIASFAQRYHSPSLSSVGVKTLAWKKVDGTWKIVSEKWEPLSSHTTTTVGGIGPSSSSPMEHARPVESSARGPQSGIPRGKGSTPVRSSGATPVPSAGATGQAGQAGQARQAGQANLKVAGREVSVPGVTETEDSGIPGKGIGHGEVLRPKGKGRIDDLLKLKSKVATPDTDLFLKGAEHFSAGRWKDVIRILRKIIQSYPESRHLERAYFLLARSFHRMFEPQKRAHSPLQKEISEHLLNVTRHYQDAITKFPESHYVPDAMVSIANCHAKAKNYHEALAYYNLVCKNYKGCAAAPEALFQRGKILASTKKPQEAIKSFQQVETLYPETLFARTAKIERAKALFDTNSFKRSLGALDEIMTAEPDRIYEDPNILLYSGYNYYELGKFKEARDRFCKVLNCYPDIDSNHLVLTKIADTYREHGMEGKALKLYNMVLRRYPDSEGSLISMLRLSADIENIEPEFLLFPKPIEEITSYNKSARETYKEIMKTHGENPLSQLAGLRLALQQQQDKDYEGSINTLRDILAKHPGTTLKEQIKPALRVSMEAIFEREQQAGNYQNIVGYYEQMKADFGLEDVPNLLLILGDAYSRFHLYDHAVSVFEEAKKSYTAQDQPADLLFGLGESFYQMRSFEEAQQALRDFVARYPEDRRVSRAYFLMGDVLLRRKEYEKAMAAFHLAIEKDPDEPCKIEILLAMAGASNGRMDYDRASGLLNRAIALMHHNKTDSVAGIYEAYQELGETYLKFGDNEQAVSAFEKALKFSQKSRDHHSLQFRLAECYERLHERDKTEEILNQIIASGDQFWSMVARAKMKEMNSVISDQWSVGSKH
ncbi:MAG: tetratricopeptide repeat protein [Desulfobacterales bacterium]|nr:tetratricopeptide repeat protein [Desulfobacterales bacterium]